MSGRALQGGPGNIDPQVIAALQARAQQQGSGGGMGGLNAATMQQGAPLDYANQPQAMRPPMAIDPQVPVRNADGYGSGMMRPAALSPVSTAVPGMTAQPPAQSFLQRLRDANAPGAPDPGQDQGGDLYAQLQKMIQQMQESGQLAPGSLGSLGSRFRR